MALHTKNRERRDGIIPLTVKYAGSLFRIQGKQLMLVTKEHWLTLRARPRYLTVRIAFGSMVILGIFANSFPLRNEQTPADLQFTLDFCGDIFLYFMLVFMSIDP